MIKVVALVPKKLDRLHPSDLGYDTQSGSLFLPPSPDGMLNIYACRSETMSARLCRLTLDL
jgi:hypothetical protein